MSWKNIVSSAYAGIKTEHALRPPNTLITANNIKTARQTALQTKTKQQFLQTVINHMAKEHLEKDDEYILDKDLKTNLMKSFSIFIYKSKNYPDDHSKKIFIKHGNISIGKEAQNAFALQDCKHIMKVLGIYENGTALNNVNTLINDNIYTLCSRYIEGNDLLDFFNTAQNFTDKTDTYIHQMLISLFIKIIVAIVCMHDKSMFHFDIKPENILYNKGDIIIIDLESARSAKPGSMTHFLSNNKVVSTSEYLLPQYLNSKDKSLIPNRNNDGKSVFNGLHQDGYAIGLMLGKFIDTIKVHTGIDIKEDYNEIITKLTNTNFDTYAYQTGLRPVIKELCTLASSLKITLDEDTLQYCESHVKKPANQPGGSRTHKKRKTRKRRHQRKASTHSKKQ
jgi:serine/threonine protein kinase